MEKVGQLMEKVGQLIKKVGQLVEKLGGLLEKVGQLMEKVGGLMEKVDWLDCGEVGSKGWSADDLLVKFLKCPSGSVSRVHCSQYAQFSGYNNNNGIQFRISSYSSSLTFILSFIPGRKEVF